MNEAKRVGKLLKVAGVIILIMTVGIVALEIGPAIVYFTSTDHTFSNGTTIRGAKDSANTLAYILLLGIVPIIAAATLCLVLWGFGIIVSSTTEQAENKATNVNHQSEKATAGWVRGD